MSDGETSVPASSYRLSLFPMVKGHNRKRKTTLRHSVRPQACCLVSCSDYLSARRLVRGASGIAEATSSWQIWPGGTCSSEKWAPSDCSAAAADLQTKKATQSDRTPVTHPFVRWKSRQSAGASEAALLPAMRSSETINHQRTFFKKKFIRKAPSTVAVSSALLPSITSTTMPGCQSQLAPIKVAALRNSLAGRDARRLMRPNWERRTAGRTEARKDSEVAESLWGSSKGFVFVLTNSDWARLH